MIYYKDLQELGFEENKTFDPVLYDRTGQKSISMRKHLCKILEDEQIKSIDLEWSYDTFMVGVYKDEHKLVDIEKKNQLLKLLTIFDKDFVGKTLYELAQESQEWGEYE